MNIPFWQALVLFFIESYVFCDQLTQTVIKRYIQNQINFTNSALEGYELTRETECCVKFEKERTVQLPGEYTDVHSFNLLNRSYLLLDHQLFDVKQENNEFKFSFRANFSEFPIGVTFVKTANYINLGLMVVGTGHGLLYIYGSNNLTNGLFLVQKIHSPHRLVDAHTFQNNGSLFLITTSTMPGALAPVTVYKWEGSYFDEITKQLLEGANKISTFTSLDSEIVIITRNNSQKVKNAYLYEFKNLILKKIQTLAHIKPIFVSSFLQEHRRYVIVFENSPYHTIYIWKGHELVPLQQFYSSTNIKNVALYHKGNTTLIFAAHQNEISTYIFKSEVLSTINNISLAQAHQVVLKTEIVDQNNKTALFLITSPDNVHVSYSYIDFTLAESQAEKLVKKDELTECLLDLTNFVMDENAEETEVIEERVTSDSIDGELTILSQAIDNNVFGISLTTQLDLLEAEVNSLRNKLDHLVKANATVIHGKLIIQGGINTYKATSKKIHTKALNSLEWTPQKWLLYSKQQSFTGNVSITDLHVDKLETNLFKDVLLKNGQQNLPRLEVNSLTASNINLNSINSILLKNIYQKSKPTVIRGRKKFTDVNSKNVKVQMFNQKMPSKTIKHFADPKGVRYHFEPNVTIKNLHVETINNIHWDKFVSSVFQVGSSQVINGEITVPNIKVEKFYTDTISNVNASTMMTTTTNQLITSNMFLGKVYTNEIIANQVNDLNFKDDVVTFEENGNITINSPVTMNKVQILNNLIITGISKEFLKENHIVGTSQEDLLQLYNERVVVLGNLYLQDVYLPLPTKVIVSGNEFNQENIKNYWLKSKNQDIPVHFEALNGISTPHLITEVLNGVNFNEYMVNDLDDKQATIFVFANASINGNVFINSQIPHRPNLQKLESEAVKLKGSYVISGVKFFTGKLKVDDLKTDLINDEPMSNFLTVYSSDVSGSKEINTLIVENNVDVADLQMQYINKKLIDDIYKQTVFTNASNHFRNLPLANATAINLFATKINNKVFSQYILELDELYAMSNLHMLMVENNATIQNAKGVLDINNVNIATKIKQMAENSLTRKSVTFTGKVHITNLYLDRLNNISFTNLLPRLYYKNWAQNITAKHTFKILSTPNLISSSINDIKLDTLIDTKSLKGQTLKAPNGLKLYQPQFLKSVQASFLQCNTNDAVESITRIPKKIWNTVTVLGNSSFSKNSKLQHLRSKAVYKNTDITIEAPATLNRVRSVNVETKNNINGISLEDIEKDAVFVDAPEQIIHGIKTFRTLELSNVQVLSLTNISIFNNFDIRSLNESIVGKNEIEDVIVLGKKTFFAGVDANDIIAPIVSGTNISNLVSLNDLHEIPQAVFENLKIADNFNVTSVNSQHFDKFLNNRLLLNSDEDQVVDAVYYIDQIQVNDTWISAINNISTDDVVFDTNEQVITGRKTFSDTVEFYNDIFMDKLNGHKINEIYNQTIWQNEGNIIDGSVNVIQKSKVYGNITTTILNGVPIDSLIDQLDNEKPIMRTEIVQNKMENIKAILLESISTIKGLPDQFVYLEKSSNLQIGDISGGIDAQVLETKNGVMIHMKIEETGEKCGFFEKCPCFSQNTIHLTTTNSINFIENKYLQRVYTYQDEEIVIHVITDTKSISYDCRANNSMPSESTNITWFDVTPTELKGYSYPAKLLNYISSVEFFKFDDQVYTVLCQYYDPNSNSHDLECLVLSFKKNVYQLMQRIKTTEAWVTHLFYTAQGIHLIIGSKGLSGVSIYRFDPYKRQFNILRSVPSSGCLSVTSIVFGYDSLVVIANSKEPVQVLKYHPGFDNYYFYHNFLLEHFALSVSTFYTGGVGASDAYLAIVTENSHFYLYGYKDLIDWKLESEARIDGLKNLVPFTLDKTSYLLALSSKQSVLLTIVKHGLK